MSEASHAEMREKALWLCRSYLVGAWMKCKPEEILFKKLSGGLSNHMFLCALPPSLKTVGREPSQVLVRLFGQGIEKGCLGRLLSETVASTILAENAFAPKLYGVFPGGRLEEYIPSRSLKSQELSLPTVSTVIAKKLGQIHSLQIPISKDPEWIWDLMYTWLSEMGSERSNEKELIFQSAVFKFNFAKEIEWLRELTLKYPSQVVFCHNDLQEGNILLCEKSSLDKVPHLYFIDFEYCGYNYRAFDIANHFLEWCFDYDCKDFPYFSYDRAATPSRRQKIEFLKEYICSCQGEECEDLKGAVTDLMNELPVYSLLTHLFWALWSVKNSDRTGIDFSFWAFAAKRLELYDSEKITYFLRMFHRLINITSIVHNLFGMPNAEWQS